MATKIGNSYQKINEARSAAAQAFRDMASAAQQAAGSYNSMGSSVERVQKSTGDLAKKALDVGGQIRKA